MGANTHFIYGLQIEHSETVRELCPHFPDPRGAGKESGSPATSVRFSTIGGWTSADGQIRPRTTRIRKATSARFRPTGWARVEVGVSPHSLVLRGLRHLF